MENKSISVKHDKARCIDQAYSGINNGDSTPHASGNAANQAGSSFSALPKATTFEQQISKMRYRGLTIDDESFALSQLQDINYYRLRGYWLTLEESGSFTKGTSFDDIWEIYQFDCELRRWLWQAIAPIEIKLRIQFAYEFSHRCGPDAYLDVFNYHKRANFERALANYQRERDRSYRQGVPCVVHNMNKYGKLPVWAAVEIMSFGTLSMFYGNLKLGLGIDENGIGLADAIAGAFGTKSRYLKSWAHHLTTVRNIAAHHDRFYNRVMVIRPLLLKMDTRYAGLRQFTTLLIIKRIYEKSWQDDWKLLGKSLADCSDRHPNVSLYPMGFPSNWKRILELPLSAISIDLIYRIL